MKDSIINIFIFLVLVYIHVLGMSRWHKSRKPKEKHSLNKITTMYNILISFWRIFILFATVETISHGYVEGMRTLDINYFELKLNGTVKTIEVREDGDLIDCMDFYKQPALKNIKMDYRSVFNKKTNPLWNKAKNPLQPLIQTWHKYGECPEGTVPIRRNRKNHTRITNPRPDNYEVANINKWEPKVANINEHSVTQIWIKSQLKENANFIEAGWIVNRKKFGDSKTRFFTYWTADGYGRTGCYNADCQPGFVLTSREFCLGCTLSPVSVYGHSDENIYISVFRDRITSNWELYISDMKVGYFPGTIFTTLAQGADTVSFGGAIVNKNSGGRHTSTEMGSGHFAEEGGERASHVRNIQIVNQQFQLVNADLNVYASHPGCYNIRHGPPGTPYETYFFYGGPGYSHQNCP